MDVFARLSKAIGGPATSSTTSQPNHAAASEQPKGSDRPAGNGRRKPDTTLDSGKGATDFKNNWRAIQALLVTPDQAALHHGVSRTDLAVRLQDLSDALVSEANRSDEELEIAGPCMEALLEGDLLGRLVKLTANDRIAGSQAQVVRLFASLIILLDERFLSRQAVHRPLVRLMRTCVGDEFFSNSSHIVEAENEDEETKAWRRFGRDGSAEVLGFEEDLVDMMCHVASRLRNTPELLIIFFRDRGGDAEAKRAFNRALSGTHSPMSTSISRSSTRPTSPSGSTSSSATIKATMPAISSPLRPPESLPVITTRKDIETASSASNSTSLTYDFPLFSYLLRFVHRESRTGELARAGLLFLVDVAFAPGRRNLSRSRRKENNVARVPAPRGVKVGSMKRGGTGTMAGMRLEDVDFGLGPSLALAKYMVESDFAEVLGASLGAVYGLMPSKLATSRLSSARENEEESSGMSLGGSILPHVEAETLHQRGIALNTSDEVRKQARLLCDLLEFTQDILRTTSRMPKEMADGEDKKRTYIELLHVAQSLTASIGNSIQKLYLENILYPSLLECSDLDGSAVAVMTYLDLMLSVLENDGILAESIVGWLIGEEVQSTAVEIESRKKRKSTAMLQLEREKGRKEEQSGYFTDALGRYTLKDLLLDHLKTNIKPEAVIAALNLASTIVTYYGRFSLQNVLQVAADDTATAFPSNVLPELLRKDDSEDADSEEFVYPGASKEEELFEQRLESMKRRVVGGVGIAQHTKEMKLYLSLANMVETGSKAETNRGPQKEDHDEPAQKLESSSTGFGNYLEDAEQSFIRDSMFWDGLCSLDEEEDDRHTRHSFRHKLIPRDLLLRDILDNLCRFWQNPPEVNVALTGFVADLVVCPLRSLEGFAVFQREEEEGQQELPSSDETTMADPDDDRSDDEVRYALTVSKAGKRAKRQGQLERRLNKHAPPPILLCVLRSLVLILDHYRPEVKGFDRLLGERRKGLLFVENLNEALQLSGLQMDGDKVESEKGHKSRYEPAENTVPKLWEGVKVETEVVEAHVSRKLSSRAKHISLPPPPSATMSEGTNDQSINSTPIPKREGFARFFGRGSATKPVTKTATDGSANGGASIPQPFAQHYQETSSLYLGMDGLRLSSKSRWSPHYKEAEEKVKVKEKRTRFQDVVGDSDNDNNVIYPGAEEEEEKQEPVKADGRDLVNLSSLLDNAVILEEFIKQLAAILQIRRANGVDAISMV